MCPIGFEETPKSPSQVYASNEEIEGKTDDWIIIGDIAPA